MNASKGRPMGAFALVVLIMGLSGLLLIAKGSPRWQGQPTGYEVATATLAARTVAVPTPVAPR